MTGIPPTDQGAFDRAMQAGQESLQRGDLESASMAFASATEIDPRAATPLRCLAGLFSQSGRHTEADDALADALALVPNSRDIQVALYRSSRRQGEHAAALAYLTILLSRFPDEPDLLIDYAETLLDLGRTQRAERSCSRVLAADPLNAKAHRALIRAAGIQGDPSVLGDRINRALAVLPSDPLLLNERVTTALPDPHFAAAQPAIVDGRTDDGRHGAEPAGVGAVSEMLAQKISLLCDIGDYAAIRAMLADQAVRGTRDPTLWSSVARALIRFGDLAEVQSWLAEAPFVFSGAGADLEELLGMLAESSCAFAEALAHYRRALEFDAERLSIEQDIARVCLVGLEVDAAYAAYGRYAQYRAEHRKPHEAVIHMSQTHFRQLLDEYRLDNDTIAALLPLRSMPANDRVAEIRRVVADNPRSTAAASSLIVSMREAGLLDGSGANTPGRDIEPAIPCRVNQFWFQADPPEDLGSHLHSWREHNPAWTYTLFNDQTAQEWLKVHQPLRVLIAYRRAVQIAQKADLFRLALLSVEGGVYADADDRCLKPFSDFIKGLSFLGYQNEFGMLGNNIVACIPDHPVIRRALVLAVRAMSRGDDELLWLSTGPGLLSRAFAQVAAGAGTGIAIPGETRIVDRRTIGSFVAMHCKVSYKATAASKWTL